jgi:hypothetical protein
MNGLRQIHFSGTRIVTHTAGESRTFHVTRLSFFKTDFKILIS